MAPFSFVRSLFALFAFFCMNNLALAQVYTTTLPWVDGNTIVVSQSTNALGATLAIQTLSTIAPVTAGALTTAVTTARTTTTRNPLLATTTVNPLLATTTAVVLTTTDDPLVVTPTTTTTTSRTSTRRSTTTAPAIVASPTTAAVSTTSWYWFTSEGNVYSTWFSPTFTTALSATPAPAGTIIAYSDYQSSINAGSTSAGSNAVLSSSASKISSDVKKITGAVLVGGMVVMGGVWML